jgi:hypothetical protein
VWAPPNELRPDGICVPFGEGLAGHVAAMALDAKTTDSGVVITNSPSLCPHWKGDNRKDSFVTRNIMTMPVWSPGKNQQLLGVIQVLNKSEAQRRRGTAHKEIINQGGLGFTQQDARLLEALAGAVGHHCSECW